MYISIGCGFDGTADIPRRHYADEIILVSTVLQVDFKKYCMALVAMQML